MCSGDKEITLKFNVSDPFQTKRVFLTPLPNSFDHLNGTGVTQMINASVLLNVSLTLLKLYRSRLETRRTRISLLSEHLE